MRGVNRLWYYWKRNNWIVDPRALFRNHASVRIDRPIFFLGEQGSGLTLVSRMIRRHPDVVTISGNCRYWVGADEMQTAMNLRLPDNLVLGGAWLRRVHAHARLTLPHSWAYASDELLPRYRCTEANYDERAARQLRRVIRESLYRHGGGEVSKRFADKSQVFTVKVSFINALLRDARPHFVVITRNPYAACYRAAIGKAGDMRRYAASMDLEQRVSLCAQHWSNSVRCALEDGEKVAHFRIMRFEDILAKPDASLRELCAFLGLSFSEDMLPHRHHTLPFGAKYVERWYPLRTDVNEPYLSTIADRYVDLIADRCGSLAGYLGYAPAGDRSTP